MLQRWYSIESCRLAAFFGIALTLGGCNCNAKSEASDTSENRPNSEPVPEAFEDLRPHLDLLKMTHLADIDREGLFIDFGAPSQLKYTVGNWNSGWGSQGATGDVTHTFVGRRGRVYFNVDTPAAMVARVRLRAQGTQALTPYINNQQLQSVQLTQDSQFRDYDVPLPAANVTRGENYLLLTFGGTTRVGNEDVAVAVDSIRIVPGGSIPATRFVPPTVASLVGDATVDGEKRRSLVVSGKASLAYYVQVPPAGVLGFGLGNASGNGGRAKVIVTPEGGAPVEVFSGAATEEWEDSRVDLGRFAGKIARVELRTEAGNARVAWSAPTIFLPQREEEAERPRQAKNVVLLLIDTMRADKLKAFNPRTRVRSPAIDALASEGAVFERAQSPENWTKPSVASVLTSLYPATHGAKQDASRVPAAATLLSEHYKANNFRTGSFIANGYVSDAFGFDQGWDHYTNYIRERKSTTAQTVFTEAGDWIEAHKDGRFFVYIQTIDPHVPYDPPAEFLNMYMPGPYNGTVRPRMTPDLLEKAKRNPPQVTFTDADKQYLEALYDGEVTYHDHWLGQFVERMKRIGVWDDTVFVVTADHGEEFNEHGSWGHGHSVYQELLHVPLLFRFPNGVASNARVPQVVSTLDIAPTLLELTGTPALPHAEGRSLTGFWRGEEPNGPHVAFSDFLDDRRVISTGRWKLIVRGNLATTLFDLENDPGEQRELDVSSNPIAMRYCRVMLGQFLGAKNRAHWLDADQRSGVSLSGEDAQMDDTIRGQLRALGYAN